MIASGTSAVVSILSVLIARRCNDQQGGGSVEVHKRITSQNPSPVRRWQPNMQRNVQIVATSSRNLHGTIDELYEALDLTTAADTIRRIGEIVGADQRVVDTIVAGFANPDVTGGGRDGGADNFRWLFLLFSSLIMSAAWIALFTHRPLQLLRGTHETNEGVRFLRKLQNRLIEHDPPVVYKRLFDCAVASLVHSSVDLYPVIYMDFGDSTFGQVLAELFQGDAASLGELFLTIKSNEFVFLTLGELWRGLKSGKLSPLQVNTALFRMLKEQLTGPQYSDKKKQRDLWVAFLLKCCVGGYIMHVTCHAFGRVRDGDAEGEHALQNAEPMDDALQNADGIAGDDRLAQDAADRGYGNGEGRGSVDGDIVGDRDTDGDSEESINLR